MTARIHVSLPQASLDVEGSEEFVRQTYEDFCQRFPMSAQLEVKARRKRPRIDRLGEGGAPGAPSGGRGPAKSELASPRRPTGRARQQRETATRPDPDLNLSTNNGTPSLKQYYAQFAPKINYERNLIFVGYLEDIRRAPSEKLSNVVDLPNG